MKRIITLSLVIAALFFTQCKKNSQTTDVASPLTEAKVEATDENKLAIESLRSLPTESLKRLAFATLKPVERYLLWIDNIKTVSAKFTPAQQTIAYELIATLRPSLFSKPDDADLKAASENWLTKATTVFTKEQIRSLAYEFQSPAQTTAINNTTLKTNFEYGAGGNCDCNMGSSFSCTGTSGCPDDFYYDDCKESSWGCGFMGGFHCNNKCHTPTIDPGSSGGAGQ